MKASEKVKQLQPIIVKLETKLKQSRIDHEHTTDLLFDEKKSNIKLMKQI